MASTMDMLEVVPGVAALAEIALLVLAFGTVWTTWSTHRLRWAAVVAAGGLAATLADGTAWLRPTSGFDGHQTGRLLLAAALLIAVASVARARSGAASHRAGEREHQSWLSGFLVLAACMVWARAPGLVLDIAVLGLLASCAVVYFRLDPAARTQGVGYFPLLLLSLLLGSASGLVLARPLAGLAVGVCDCLAAACLYATLREHCLVRPFKRLAGMEQRLRSVMDASPDCMLVVAGDGRIVGCNDRVPILFGYAREELIGQSVDILVPMGKRGAHAGLRQGYARHPGVRDMGAARELSAATRSGEQIPVDVSLSPLRLDNEAHVIAVVRDLRERKTAERELRRTERQLRTLMESTPDAMFRFDRDLTASYANSAALMSPLWRDLVPGAVAPASGADMPRAVALLRERLEQAFGSGEPGVTELHEEDGHRIWLLRLVPEHGEEGSVESVIAVVTDISAAMRSARENRRSHAILETIPEAVCITDPKGGVEYLNPAARRLLSIDGQPADEPLRLEHFIPAHQLPHVRESAMGIAMERGHWRGEISVAPRHGTELPVDYTLLAQGDAGGTGYLTHIFSDISERKEFERRLLMQATHDSLTGLPNRSILHDQIRRVIHRAMRNARLAAVLFIDLDDFKIINDSLGHHVGDELLVQVARRLTRTLRASDTVVRVGGDEFAVIIEDIGHRGELLVIVDTLRAALWTPYELGGRHVNVTGSIGIYIVSDSQVEPSDILRHADMAMYAAKRREKGSWAEYQSHMDAELRDMVELKAALRQAVANDELRLHYQPKLSLVDGYVTGMEALLRWQHPTRGLLGPDRFISLAEQSGLILPIGEWVLRTACRQARLRHQSGLPRHRIAVNLSPRQFRDARLAATVAGILRETGLEPELLELEITESLVMDHPEEALQTMRELRALGVVLAIDDFGTGHSSLAALRRFPVDFIKVDRAFIGDVTTNPNDAAITSAIISMAQILGLKVIAEGVETQAQVEFLSGQGCDEYQGYYFSRPVPEEKLDDCLRRWPAKPPSSTEEKSVIALNRFGHLRGARTHKSAAGPPEGRCDDFEQCEVPCRMAGAAATQHPQ